MVWQDVAMAILNLFGAYALVQQVYYGFKNKIGSITLQTSIITTMTLFCFSMIFVTLNMFMSAGICTFNSVMWSLLLIQRIKYGEAKIDDQSSLTSK